MQYTMNAAVFPPHLRSEIDSGYVEGLVQWFSYSAQRHYSGWDHNNSTQDYVIASQATPWGQVLVPAPVTDLVIARSGSTMILSWTPVLHAVAYRIYQSTTPDFSGAVTGVTIVGTTWLDRCPAGTCSEARKFYRIGAVGMDPPLPPP
jgi:hypothetical protein